MTACNPKYCWRQNKYLTSFGSMPFFKHTLVKDIIKKKPTNSENNLLTLKNYAFYEVSSYWFSAPGLNAILLLANNSLSFVLMIVLHIWRFCNC